MIHNWSIRLPCSSERFKKKEKKKSIFLFFQSLTFESYVFFPFCNNYAFNSNQSVNVNNQTLEYRKNERF